MAKHSVMSDIDRTYDETMALLDEAKAYMTRSNEMVARSDDAARDLRKACEASRVTAQLSQVVAWLLAQRAVAAGELSRAEAVETYGLTHGDTCLDLKAVDDDDLPYGLRNLLKRGANLYERVSVLEKRLSED